MCSYGTSAGPGGRRHKFCEGGLQKQPRISIEKCITSCSTSCTQAKQQKHCSACLSGQTPPVTFPCCTWTVWTIYGVVVLPSQRHGRTQRGRSAGAAAVVLLLHALPANTRGSREVDIALCALWFLRLHIARFPISICRAILIAEEPAWEPRWLGWLRRPRRTLRWSRAWEALEHRSG